jgi:hypothetical protein
MKIMMKSETQKISSARQTPVSDLLPVAYFFFIVPLLIGKDIISNPFAHVQIN